MKKLIWLSYDLGLKGDYENMYAWLDSYKAKECGPNCAAFSFEFKQDLLKELADQISDNISLDKSDRIYVIYPELEPSPKRKGKFLFGKRKPAPWAGYATEYEEETEDES
ncbi:MAG: hypothetical protein HC875_34645 [Anaerolineales bacterium]|nr:hypothetical protein [Anaerolineales bacterium]